MVIEEVEEYIWNSTKEQQHLIRRARSIILSTSPKMEERFKYKIPFYSCMGNICYINRLKEGIDIGFVRGFELADPHGKLVGEGRTQVKSLRVQSRQEFDEDLLRDTVNEAILLNELRSKK